MKVVKYCDNSFEANVVKGMLFNEGIDACVINEHSSTTLPFSTSIMSLSPQIVVADRDYPHAMEILAVTSTKPICPECGSDHVEFSFSSRKPLQRFLIRYVLFPLSLLSASPIGMVQRTYVCKECRHQF